MKGVYRHFDDKMEESGGRWYFSRKEIEENSPSRPDGINLKKETYLRKSYCTFLQDLSMRLKVKQLQLEFLDHGVLTLLKNWLEPLPDGSLPNINIRAAILKILTEFPIDLDQYD